MAELEQAALPRLTPGQLAARFRRFAEHECDSSPLYRRLSLGIAEDPDLLALAAQAQNTPVPNLLLAAVHFLLLSGVTHPLANFFFNTSDRDPYPPFQDFCLQHRRQIEEIIRARLVQTNEVRRCALLLRALIWPGPLYAVRAGQLEQAVAVAQRETRTPVALINGDALERLPEVLAAVPGGATACVFHSFTLNQFPPTARQRFWAILSDYGQTRPVFEIGLEWLGGDGPLLGLSTFDRGVRIETMLAACHPHGEWMEWKRPASAA
jgi:hypothetical protein